MVVVVRAQGSGPMVVTTGFSGGHGRSLSKTQLYNMATVAALFIHFIRDERKGTIHEHNIFINATSGPDRHRQTPRYKEPQDGLKHPPLWIFYS